MSAQLASLLRVKGSRCSTRRSADEHDVRRQGRHLHGRRRRGDVQGIRTAVRGAREGDLLPGRQRQRASAKLVVNLVLGLNRMVLAEGLCLATKAGMDPHRTLDLLKKSAAYSKAMDMKGLKMIEQDFSPPEGKLAFHLKDVRLMLDLAAGSTSAHPQQPARPGPHLGGGQGPGRMGQRGDHGLLQRPRGL